MRLVILIGTLILPPTASAAEPLHAPWQALLDAHVETLSQGYATRVDYDGMLRDRARLERYLERLASVSRESFDAWTPARQLAFLLNAYNAWTIDLVLSAYPELDSIRDLGNWFRSPWERRFVSLFGKEWTLDELEHDLIRGSGRYREPRIHFAVNCASIGCPALSKRAFTGDDLDAQLDAATRRFLSDRSRNRLEDGRLRVSRIFDWYRGDFESGWRGADSLAAFLARYADALELTPEQAQRLAAGEIQITFLRYDWGLNDA